MSVTVSFRKLAKKILEPNTGEPDLDACLRVILPKKRGARAKLS